MIVTMGGRNSKMNRLIALNTCINITCATYLYPLPPPPLPVTFTPPFPSNHLASYFPSPSSCIPPLTYPISISFLTRHPFPSESVTLTLPPLPRSTSSFHMPPSSSEFTSSLYPDPLRPPALSLHPQTPSTLSRIPALILNSLPCSSKAR